MSPRAKSKPIKSKSRARSAAPDESTPAPSIDLDTTARDWLTDALRALLNVLPDPHSAKKRTTVLRLAFAMANREPVKDVFGRDDTCAEAIWYGKWQHDPAIKAAFDACYARALEWRDQETVALEAYYRTKRLRKIAEYAALAPDTYKDVMQDIKQIGTTRINAASRLISLADPDTASKAQLNQPGGVEQNVTINELADDDLIALIVGGRSAPRGDASGSAGTAEASPGAN